MSLPSPKTLTLFLVITATCVYSTTIAQTDNTAASPDIRYAPEGIAMPHLIAILNAPTDGILAEATVEEGQFVKTGQALIRMKDDTQQVVVRIAQLKADSLHSVERAKMELAEAETMHQRMLQASNTGAAGKWEVRRSELRRDIAEIAHQAAIAAQQIAQQELALEQARLERFKLSAPWDGQVTLVTTDPGVTVSREDPLIQMVNTEKLKAEIYIPLSLFGKLTVGKTYTLTALDPINQPIEAELTFADSVINHGSKRFRCVFTIDNPELTLPAGFAVQFDPSQP